MTSLSVTTLWASSLACARRARRWRSDELGADARVVVPRGDDAIEPVSQDVNHLDQLGEACWRHAVREDSLQRGLKLGPTVPASVALSLHRRRTRASGGWTVRIVSIGAVLAGEAWKDAERPKHLGACGLPRNRIGRQDHPVRAHRALRAVRCAEGTFLDACRAEAQPPFAISICRAVERAHQARRGEGCASRDALESPLAVLVDLARGTHLAPAAGGEKDDNDHESEPEHDRTISRSTRAVCATFCMAQVPAGWRRPRT